MNAPPPEQQQQIMIPPPEKSIEVGPVKVNTGSNWLDLGFVVIIILILGLVFKRKWIDK